MDLYPPRNSPVSHGPACGLPRPRRLVSFAVALLGIAALGAAPARAAEEPRPKRDYLKIVRDYADAMIDHGRDVYGKEHSPLFAEAQPGLHGPVRPSSSWRREEETLPEDVPCLGVSVVDDPLVAGQIRAMTVLDHQRRIDDFHRPAGLVLERLVAEAALDPQ